MLEIAGYIIAHPSILTGQSNFFERHSQYECFNKIFNEVVRAHWSEFECLGISVEYFITHFIRKGAATYIATCCTVYPPVASTFLRTNWTSGGVKERYIKYKKSGDQFIGRAVTGLPILKEDLQFTLLILIFCHAKMIARRKENSPS